MARRIVIVGAGAAGVYTAYRLRQALGEACELTLLERSTRVGGNAMATRVGDVADECGAQFFHRGAQSRFMALLTELDLFDVAEVVRTPAGFTIWDRVERRRLLHLPATLEGLRSLGPGDWLRATKFGLFLAYSYALERWESDWTLTVAQWFARMHLLDDGFKHRVLAPFLYQFLSLPAGRIGEASAKYAVTYLVRTLFPGRSPEPAVPRIGRGRPTFEAYQSLVGLDEIHRRVLAAAHVSARIGAEVVEIRHDAGGSIEVVTTAGTLTADDVVLATDPHAAAAMLARGGTSAGDLIDGLRALEYAALPISMQHGQPTHMPERRGDWQPFNTIVDGESLTFSVWFGPMRPPLADGSLVPAFKSWGSPGLATAATATEFLAHQHHIPLPTAAFMATRDPLLARWQGQRGVWFAGGWTQWFDSQEAALLSAETIARGLAGAAHEPVPEHDARRGVQALLDRTAAHAPATVRGCLAHALDEVEVRG
jgi:NAD(P)-binding Rossmann-like domain